MWELQINNNFKNNQNQKTKIFHFGEAAEIPDSRFLKEHHRHGRCHKKCESMSIATQEMK
jgi:hypothetical protein